MRLLLANLYHMPPPPPLPKDVAPRAVLPGGGLPGRLTIPRAARCRVFYHTIESRLGPAQESRFLSVLRSPWELNEVANEIWVQRAMGNHPWRVDTVLQADLILVGVNATACAWQTSFGQMGGSRCSEMHQSWLRSTLQGPANPPAAITVQAGAHRTQWGARTIMLVPRELSAARKYRSWPQVLLPAALSFVDMRRDSQELQNATRDLPAWEERPLLHFVGHVPKHGINPLRLLIWAQINAASGVTARSHNVRCHLAPFTICEEPDRIEKEFKSYCKDWCGCGKDGNCEAHPCRRRNSNLLKEDCRSLRTLGLNASRHLLELNRSHHKGHVQRVAWLRQAATHRFCLVAAGDTYGTQKLPTFVVLGAEGGCIPLLVISHRIPMLPYAQWIDWCKAAVLVSENTARSNMSGVLSQLRLMTAAEGRAKVRALNRIRDAFLLEWPGVRDVSAPWRPSAADFAVAAACDIARRAGRNGGPRELANATAAVQSMATHRFRRCTL